MGAKLNFPNYSNSFGAIRAFWALLRPYRGRVAIGLFGLIAVDLANVSLPLVIRSGVDSIAASNTEKVLWAAMLILGIHFVQAGMRYVWRVYLIGTSHFVARDLRKSLYGQIQNLPVNRLKKMHTGDLMNRATNDVEAVRMAVGPGLLISADAVLNFLLMIPLMLYLSPKLTAFAFFLCPIVPIVTKVLGDRVDVLFEKVQARMSKIGAFTQERLSAIRLIKSLSMEAHTRKQFQLLSEGYRDEAKLLAKYESLLSPTLSAINNFGMLMILWVGGLDVISGAITIGTFIAFQRFVSQLAWPMEAIGWSVELHREGSAALRRVQSILSLDKVRPTLTGRPGSSTALFEIRSLQFRYDENQNTRFSIDIGKFKIPSGQRIGIVGPIGSGKSTFLQLAQRIYEPPTSSLYLDKRDVTSIPLTELRHELASVEQQVFLFSESVRNNILLGADNEDAPSRVEKAIETACISDEIFQLDNGFDTLLGEKGVTLSGGQKQRLAIARALVRKPKLLLLDDCFSAVDVRVEEEIIQRLLSNYPSMAFILATHRMSILPRLDRVWMMNAGSIVADGSHEGLLKENPLYRELWRKREEQTERPTLTTHSDSNLRESDRERGKAQP